MEDQAIVSLYFARREEAVARTQEKYGRYLESIARNILPDREDCRESVNDAYLAAWNSIPPQRPEKLGLYLGKLTYPRSSPGALTRPEPGRARS